MRTTVNIDDRLLQHAKELATRTRRPLGAIVDDALTMLLSRVDQPDRGGAVDLPTYGALACDLEGKEALAARLEADGGPSVLLADVNAFIYAHRHESGDHNGPGIRQLLRSAPAPSPGGLCDGYKRSGYWACYLSCHESCADIHHSRRGQAGHLSADAPYERQQDRGSRPCRARR